MIAARAFVFILACAPMPSGQTARADKASTTEFFGRYAGQAISATEEGGYEMRIYDHTLAADGLKLRFPRIRDGKERWPTSTANGVPETP